MSRFHPTVVLAHGAWADGSSWSKVVVLLKEHGLDVVAAPLPLTSLADDAAALDRVLERIEGPCVLVGHAYAGAVIGAAGAALDPAALHEKIAALVYVAGLAPDAGETVADVFYRGEQHPQAPQLAPDAHGWIWLPETAFGTVFAQDAGPADRAVLAAAQRPISVACITAAVERPLWKERPSWYLVAQEDRMIAAETQRFLAARMQAHVHVRPVDHVPMLTAPDAVAEIVLEALRSAAASGLRDLT